MSHTETPLHSRTPRDPSPVAGRSPLQGKGGVMASLNCCPRRQCRGRTVHSTIRHWTPAYLVEVAVTVKLHAQRRCPCGDPLLVDLAHLTWDAITT